ncbi:MAG: DUF2617 family protein [Planctomycetota bacterium]|nr:DUF2617 family protein [Planctomycetota bacterium]
MNHPSSKTNCLQTYQAVLYGRALHPEIFQLKSRRVFRQGEYELEVWMMRGSHLLRFEHKSLCASELVTDAESLPQAGGVLSAFLCAGERDYEYAFDKAKVAYMTTVQTETLADNIYDATYQEMLDLAAESKALLHEWEDDAGRCLSLVDVQKYQTEVHAQAYHLQANGGVVLRTQSIFEIR